MIITIYKDSVKLLEHYVPEPSKVVQVDLKDAEIHRLRASLKSADAMVQMLQETIQGLKKDEKFDTQLKDHLRILHCILL